MCVCGHWLNNYLNQVYTGHRSMFSGIIFYVDVSFLCMCPCVVCVSTPAVLYATNKKEGFSYKREHVVLVVKHSNERLTRSINY